MEEFYYMDYSIGEFSKITEISIYTLRYYESEHLIKPDRKSNGRRVYKEKDITWIQFIKRLKDTGMPIKEIKKYAELRSDGESTMTERMIMLTHHKKKLEGEIDILNEHLEKLKEKIIYYEGQIKNKV